MLAKIEEEKAYWRRTMKRLRQSLSAQERKVRSESVCQTILHHPSIQESSSIAAFYPTKEEVDILPALHELFKEKDILLPRWEKQAKDLSFYKVQDWKSLEERELGILQPLPKGAVFPPQAIEVILVPGLAFDRDGFRLGYGGGYYDRFLSHLGWNCVNIGVCFQFQIIERVPHTTQDIPVQELIYDDTSEKF